MQGGASALVIHQINTSTSTSTTLLQLESACSLVNIAVLPAITSPHTKPPGGGGGCPASYPHTRTTCTARVGVVGDGGLFVMDLAQCGTESFERLLMSGRFCVCVCIACGRCRCVCVCVFYGYVYTYIHKFV